MEKYLIYFLQSVLLIILTPLFMGIIKNIKAFIRGYRSVPVLQIYYDCMKLISKGRVISVNSSFITRIGPTLSFGAALTAAFIVPVFYTNPINTLGNMFVIIFILGIVKFINSLIGLDCASTFGGMGSSRELFISMLAEPIMFIMVAFLYLETLDFNVYGISYINSNVKTYSVAHIIAATSFFMLVLAENSRMPMDNPETHLELTMVHEAMILDLSGRDLAFVELASGIKLMVFLTLFINCFIPFGMAGAFSFILILKSLILYIIKLLICVAVISVIETTMAKFRLFRLPEILAAAFSIGIVAIAINYFV
jgi:formate hydrogenlyase subunit 4